MRVLLTASMAILPALASGQDPPRASEPLDDAAFWQLAVDLSEPDGYFEDENYVSNELYLQQVLPRLQETVAPGGVFLGVGPEQNLTYVAALRPRIAFVIDIRRQNAMEHLMYKALFELSEDRADFLSRLFSRPRPEGLQPGTLTEDLFAAYGRVAPNVGLFEDSLESILNVLKEEHAFGLTPADEASIRKVLEAFYEKGPEIMYVFRGTSEPHPTYPRLMDLVDETGENWSYLGSEETSASSGACSWRTASFPSWATSPGRRPSARWATMFARPETRSTCSTSRTSSRTSLAAENGKPSTTTS